MAEKAPGWFVIVSVIILLWNLLGLASLLLDPYLYGTMPAGAEMLYAERPDWAFYGFSLATISGTLAAILLLAKRKLAMILFFLSLLGILLQNGWIINHDLMREKLGMALFILPAFTVVLALLSMWLTAHGSQRGWLK